MPRIVSLISSATEIVHVLGQRYDANPAVVMIPVTGPTSISAEMSLPNGPDALETWQTAGYSTDKFEAAWSAAITTYAEAFPFSQLAITLYPGLPIPDRDAGDKTRTNIAAAAVTQLGSKLAIQTSGLSARKEEMHLGCNPLPSSCAKIPARRSQ